MLSNSTSCQKRPAAQLNDTTPTPDRKKPDDCSWDAIALGDKAKDTQRFLVGKWAGHLRLDQEPVMYLTFQENGTVIVDNSTNTKAGDLDGILHLAYRLKDEKTMNICGYPDDFEIDKHPEDFEIDKLAEDVFTLRSYSQGTRVSIELIYTCTFKRFKHEP